MKDVKIKELRVMYLKQKNENGHRLALFSRQKVIFFFFFGTTRSEYFSLECILDITL